MLQTGAVSGLVVLRPVSIDGQWEALDATADRMSSGAAEIASNTEVMGADWQRLRGAYQDSATQEVVWSAFDQVPQVSSEWARVVAQAAGVLQGLAAEGKSARSQAENLEADALRLEAQLAASELLTGGADSSGTGTDEGESSQDQVLRARISEHNNAVTALGHRWEAAQDQAISELEALNSGGGLADDIPEVTAASGDFMGGGVDDGALFNSAGGVLSGGGAFGVASTLSTAGAGLSFAPGFPLANLASTLGTGNTSSEDKVQEAADLYESTTGRGSGAEQMQNFYDHLATMSPEEIEDFASTNTRIHIESPPLPENQEDLDQWPNGAEWWDSLDESQQDKMVSDLPLVTGNTEGVPYEERDEANQTALTYLLSASAMTATQKKRLQEIERSLRKTGRTDTDRMLLSLNTGETWHSSDSPDPLAAVSVGNPDEADTTNINVPGMGSGTYDMTSEVDRAQELHSGLDGSHAVVSWVGYDAPESHETSNYIPDWAEVWSDEKADQGGWALAHALDGYQDTMGGLERETAINLTAHSYGTNTAVHALTRTDQAVDTFSMFGSAGLPANVAPTTESLKVERNDEGNPAVYATKADEDQWADRGRIFNDRIDPTDDDDFGAYVFSSDGYGNVDGNPVTDHRQNFFDEGGLNDYGYYDADSQSYNSAIKIMEGNADSIEFDPETPHRVDRSEVGI